MEKIILSASTFEFVDEINTIIFKKKYNRNYEESGKKNI